MTAAIAPTSQFVTGPRLVENLALLNLLIVDDERAVREACKEAAVALGYRTSASESTEHALRLLDSQNIDVVLLDLKMPGAGGLELLRHVKQRHSEVEVVVVTRTRHRGIRGPGHESWRLRLRHQTVQLGRTQAAAGAGRSPPEAQDREPDAARKNQIQTGFRQHYRPRTRNGQTLPHHREGRP